MARSNSINGNGFDPTKEDLLQVGVQAGLRKKVCQEKIDEVQECVGIMLGEYIGWQKK